MLIHDPGSWQGVVRRHWQLKWEKCLDCTWGEMWKYLVKSKLVEKSTRQHQVDWQSWGLMRINDCRLLIISQNGTFLPEHRHKVLHQLQPEATIEWSDTWIQPSQPPGLDLVFVSHSNTLLAIQPCLPCWMLSPSVLRSTRLWNTNASVHSCILKNWKQSGSIQF